MKAQVTIDCKNCFDDVTVDVEFKGKSLIARDVFTKVRQKGWFIGRDCYCPDCFSKLPDHCSTCTHFEGNKSMGACICRLDGMFTTSMDYCNNHSKM